MLCTRFWNNGNQSFWKCKSIGKKINRYIGDSKKEHKCPDFTEDLEDLHSEIQTYIQELPFSILCLSKLNKYKKYLHHILSPSNFIMHRRLSYPWIYDHLYIVVDLWRSYSSGCPLLNCDGNLYKHEILLGRHSNDDSYTCLFQEMSFTEAMIFNVKNLPCRAHFHINKLEPFGVWCELLELQGCCQPTLQNQGLLDNIHSSSLISLQPKQLSHQCKQQNCPNSLISIWD